MKTIKEELRDAYQKNLANWKTTRGANKNEKEDNIEVEARNFIENVLIYKFRLIALKKPLCNYLFIEFNYNKNWVRFFSNIDPLTYMTLDSADPIEVVEKACYLARNEYGIGVDIEKCPNHMVRYMFFLDLS